jgi:hypothetical protein
MDEILPPPGSAWHDFKSFEIHVPGVITQLPRASVSCRSNNCLGQIKHNWPG